MLEILGGVVLCGVIGFVFSALTTKPPKSDNTKNANSHNQDDSNEYKAYRGIFGKGEEE